LNVAFFRTAITWVVMTSLTMAFIAIAPFWAHR
jgi:hypothetical protein